jgi:pyrroline-5-carboxylate reductase
MSIQTIGFVGGGRITRIFLEGWRRANALPANIRATRGLPEDQTVSCDV